MNARRNIKREKKQRTNELNKRRKKMICIEKKVENGKKRICSDTDEKEKQWLEWKTKAVTLLNSYYCMTHAALWNCIYCSRSVYFGNMYCMKYISGIVNLLNC